MLNCGCCPAQVPAAAATQRAVNSVLQVKPTVMLAPAPAPMSLLAKAAAKAPAQAPAAETAPLQAAKIFAAAVASTAQALAPAVAPALAPAAAVVNAAASTAKALLAPAVAPALAPAPGDHTFCNACPDLHAICFMQGASTLLIFLCGPVCAMLSIPVCCPKYLTWL